MKLPHLANNWKSTAAGILSFGIATLTTLLAYQIPMAILNPGQTKMYLYFTIIGNVILALFRAWIGLITQDAGTTLATVPGSPTPQVVPSHEIPNQIAAKAVLPEVKP